MSLKIIVIANGPNALDYEAGDVIDSFDFVVRMNCYQTQGYEKYIGSKTDIWVTTNDFDRFIEEYDGLLEQRKKEFFKENWTTDTKDIETFAERHEIKCNEIHFINMWVQNTLGNVLKDDILHENKICLDTFDTGLLREMSQNLKININNERGIIKVASGKNLSTGLHTLIYAIYRWIGHDIYIHGFDFFKSGREYFSGPENSWEMNHSADIEESIVERWIKEGILKVFNGENNA